MELLLNYQVIADYVKPLCSGNNYIIRNTQEFPKLLQQQDPLLPNEEYVPYDVKSLFTNVPIQETIDYILDEIYVKNKLPKICSKLIFKRLLLKLRTENTFMFTSEFYKQADGCTMGGPLSVIFSDIYIYINIYMTKTERAVVNPSKPKFYKRFVDDIINRRNKNQPDDLFQKLNGNHPNMKYTVEIKPECFLDTKIVYSNDVLTAEVKRNERKLQVHWSSKVPKRYKRNAIISDLNRATRIAAFQQMRYQKLNKNFLMLTIHINLSTVSLITFKTNQRKLTTISSPMVSLMFQRRLY